MSSRTARSAEPARHPGRPAGPSRCVIPDGPQGRAGIQTGATQEPLDPRLRGDDSKKGGASLFTMSSRTARSAEPARHPGRPAGPSRDPDGHAQVPLDSRPTFAGAGFRGDDGKKGGASLFMMSSRTARSAEPVRHPGRHTLFMVSSRTARRAEPGSRWAPRKSRWIPVRAYMDASFPAGMTARTRSRHFLFLVVIPGPPRPEPGIRRRGDRRMAARAASIAG